MPLRRFLHTNDMMYILYIKDPAQNVKFSIYFIQSKVVKIEYNQIILI